MGKKSKTLKFVIIFVVALFLITTFSTFVLYLVGNNGQEDIVNDYWTGDVVEYEVDIETGNLVETGDVDFTGNLVETGDVDFTGNQVGTGS